MRNSWAIRGNSCSLNHDLAASVDVKTLGEAGWHGACPYTVELAAVERVPRASPFCDFRDFRVNCSRILLAEVSIVLFNFRIFLFNTEKAENAEMHREEYDFRKERRQERPKGLAQRLAHERWRRSPLCRAFWLLLPPPCLVKISLCSSVLS